MASVIAFSRTGAPGLPSRCKNPAIPHMFCAPMLSALRVADVSSRRISSDGTRPQSGRLSGLPSDLGHGPALRDLGDMVGAPLDEALESIVEVDACGKADLGARLLRTTNAVAHKRRLAARCILDRLVRAGEVEEPLGQLLERSALARADIVEAVGRRR